MDALTPVGPALRPSTGSMNTVSVDQQVSLIHVSDLPIIPSPTTPLALAARFPTLPLSSSGFPLARVWASPFSSRLADFQAESSSFSYGLIVHLLLLPTPPRGDAVAVGYRPESACLKRTSTSLTKHAFRRTGAGAPRTLERTPEDNGPTPGFHRGRPGRMARWPHFQERKPFNSLV